MALMTKLVVAVSAEMVPDDEVEAYDHHQDDDDGYVENGPRRVNTPCIPPVCDGSELPQLWPRVQVEISRNSEGSAVEAARQAHDSDYAAPHVERT